MAGLGTLINIAAILVGSTLGVWFGYRLPERTTRTVTDALGLVTFVIGGLNVVALLDPDYVAAVGEGITFVIVLLSLLIGGVIGSLLRIQERLEAVGGWLQRRLVRDDAPPSRARFVEGFVAASLIFGIGPLAVLGAISDGLGRGIDQLALKSVLDGFAAMAFAASFGVGVMFSAVSVLVVQGLLTLFGVLLGGLVPDSHISALTATGGLLLAGIGLRLLRIRDVPVGDMLPALIVAPLLTQIVIWLR